MRSAIRNQTRIKYKNHLGIVDDIQVSDHINYGIPVLDEAEQIAGNLWRLYNDSDFSVVWDEISGEYTFNGVLSQTETIELFSIATQSNYLYIMEIIYDSGSTNGYVEFISGLNEAVTYEFNGDKLFTLEYIEYIMFRFTQEDRYSFENFKFKIKLNKALYTGEKVDKYSESNNINAVIQNKMGKVYNEQMGVMYEYSSTLQHTGKPVLNEAALVWIRNDHQDKPDFIVRSVVPSINSTIYHLIKKET